MRALRVFQALRVAALPFVFEVRSVTDCLDFQTLFFHFEPSKLTLELLNPCV